MRGSATRSRADRLDSAAHTPPPYPPIPMKKLLILPLFLLVFACTQEESREPAKPETPSTPVAAAISGEHTVKCGCAVDAVGECGNYVQIEGEFVEITGDVGLGVMEWCQQGEKKADVTGTMVDGKFLATAVVTK